MCAFERSARADPIRASTLLGSALNARSKKPRACTRLFGLTPLFCEAKTWKYRSIEFAGWGPVVGVALGRHKLGVERVR